MAYGPYEKAENMENAVAGTEGQRTGRDVDDAVAEAEKDRVYDAENPVDSPSPPRIGSEADANTICEAPEALVTEEVPNPGTLDALANRVWFNFKEDNHAIGAIINGMVADIPGLLVEAIREAENCNVDRLTIREVVGALSVGLEMLVTKPFLNCPRRK